MVSEINYKTIAKVLETWEHARQRFGSEEEVGMKIIHRLFQAEPETKVVFGFKTTKDINNHPMLRMGVLIHGAHIVKMMDIVLSLLGPDVEMLEEILGQLGQRHQMRGVKKEYFPLLGDAIRETLSLMIGDKYTDEDDAAWKEVYDALSAEIVKAIT